MSYILITTIIIIIVAIIYKFYFAVEGFEPDHVFDKRIKLDNFNGNGELPIQNYIIKSSYNSAMDAHDYASKNAIKYVLGRGCRFLDFEVVFDPKKPNAAYVGKVTGKRNEGIDSNNLLLLDDAFDTILSYGFSKPTPNPNDPLFIHLRIRPLIKQSLNAQSYQDLAQDLMQGNDLTKQDRHNELFDNVNSTVNSKLAKKMYQFDVDVTKTTFNELKNKIVIIIESDKSIDLNNAMSFKFIESRRASDLGAVRVMSYNEYASQENNKSIFSFLSTCDCDKEKLPAIEFTKERTLITPQNIRVGVPEFPFDSDAVNEPSCYDMITKHAMQIPTFRFHNKTANLRDYEELFEHFKSSFIVLESGIIYINRITEQ